MLKICLSLVLLTSLYLFLRFIFVDGILAKPVMIALSVKHSVLVMSAAAAELRR